ncbi:MFS transporter [Metabacillus malikii]|uniref:GPH family glycoside/pentoside/hexuronide:cation symporter n=1 Tax=Metabacillus malikii TaxID=1504265 RepID=A0ABT9ZDJ6_9BACI|nr:MFS transporter [Metabacillus malikii]MDQ0229653.1 GPH family glycoside/pentoside/hexuronide:cation symporter [Metabacillus malikii]
MQKQSSLQLTAKIGLVEKVGYASGDLASNLIYQTISIYLLFFYTNIYGISAGAAATMFFVVRIIDAISDPLVGALVDRTNTRFGRFRPYLLYWAIPFAGLAFLCFTTPDFTEGGKLIYAYVTYVGLSIVYTFVNVPYAALTPAITANNSEIVSLTSVRMIFANLGGVIVSYFVPYLSGYFGEFTSPSRSWQLTMGIIGAVGAILLLFCFFSTKERVKPVSEEKVKFSDIFEQFRKNRPLVVLSIFFVLIFGVNSISSSIGVYFVTYNMGREDLVGLYTVLGSLPAFLCIPLIPYLNKKLGKKVLLNASLILSIIGTLSLLIIPTSMVSLILISRVVTALGTLTAGAFMWALVPETIEYGEYVTGKRLSGLIYAIIGFFFKCGMALGGAIPGVILSQFGYVANETQTSHALLGILIATAVIPAVILLLAMVDINFYNLDNKKHTEVIEELKRRANVKANL